MSTFFRGALHNIICVIRAPRKVSEENMIEMGVVTEFMALVLIAMKRKRGGGTSWQPSVADCSVATKEMLWHLCGRSHSGLHCSTAPL